MPIRNPFARRPGAIVTPGENAGDGGAPSPTSSINGTDAAHPGFERVDTVGSKASSALSIRSRRSQDTGEYKMSVVNDSGIYLPPSPTEEAKWPKRYLSLSRASSDTRSSSQGEIEHFSISRESFDSYRRSFDISAKTPITPDLAPRQSLDSAGGRFTRLPPRSSPSMMRQEQQRARFEQLEPPTPEEPGFEDVGLNDDGKQNEQGGNHHASKRRGFFSKFGADGHTTTTTTTTTTMPATPPHHHDDGAAGLPQTVSRFLLSGRRRGHSGQGAELGAMPISSASAASASASAAVERPNTANSSFQEQVEVRS